MFGKTILSVSCPVTQSREAVEALLNALGRQADPLPGIVELNRGVRLVLSHKGDVYYTVTPTACSCPGHTYHPGQPCKHMKALQQGNTIEASRAQARAYQARQREIKAKAKAKASSLPTPEESLMPRGGFRPVAPEVA